MTPNARPSRSNHVNQAELAYDRLEERIVTLDLRPGLYLSIQDLQQRTGVGRTPTHLAASRLAAETLITIRPRHGLQVTPIDLQRERTLLLLRREMERFVVRLASERAGASHRNTMLYLLAALGAPGDAMPIEAFNQLDRQIDTLLIDAAGEAFLGQTLRPLHTIFRRIGWIYHRWGAPAEGVEQTVACHRAILGAVAAGQTQAAIRASDRLIDFSSTMFDVLGNGMDPALFNCNLAYPAPT